jgi:hypothetical protein
VLDSTAELAGFKIYFASELNYESVCVLQCVHHRFRLAAATEGSHKVVVMFG